MLLATGETARFSVIFYSCT